MYYSKIRKLSCYRVNIIVWLLAQTETVAKPCLSISHSWPICKTEFQRKIDNMNLKVFKILAIVTLNYCDVGAHKLGETCQYHKECRNAVSKPAFELMLRSQTSRKAQKSRKKTRGR